MQAKDSSRRPFATGSKPGPDAVDHFLEGQGFYRKHVARDASSLYRVVAEQVFDVQNYHEKVRQDCASFMETRSKEYANEVDKNFYNYISQLRRNRTHGTLLELRVLARMYCKNVILFEPTQNLQTIHHIYVQDDAFNKNEPLRVFYSHKDKHFDVIYTMDYVERLAECQAIVYSILYTDVFKLPDVQYAVERMLHDQEEQTTLPLESDPSKYVTQAGDVIAFESHTETNCVLKDPKTCHFHNQVDFEEVVNEHKDAITVINRTDEPGRLKIYKPIDGFLHDMQKSCVRQLLDEKITPFPYKVAKALDPSIYRNTEFELWSENRKEQRLKWLDSAELPMKQQMDEKWFVYEHDKYRRSNAYNMRKFHDGKYEQAVVDENAYMALDDDMKKKYVVLDSSVEPFKLHQLANFDNFMPAKEGLELTVMPSNLNYVRSSNRGRRGFGRFSHNNNYHHNRSNYNSQHYYNGSNQNQPHMTYVADIERETSYQYQESDEQPTFYSQQQQQSQQNESFVFENHQETLPQPQIYQAIQPSASWSAGPMVPYIQQMRPQAIPFAAPLSYQNVMPFGNFSIPPPPSAAGNSAPTSEPTSADGGDAMNIMRDSELASTNIDWNPKESMDQSGKDLPLNDIATLQFYYNVGVRYFYSSGVQRRLKSVALQLENLDLKDNAAAAEDKSNEQKSDPPPVPTNTPVTTKQVGGNYGPPGNRYHNNSHGNGRRPFSFRENHDNNYRGSWNSNNNSSGSGYNSRKEIKFNSNVKNVHKNEAKANVPSKNGSGANTAVQTQTFYNNVSAGGNHNNSAVASASEKVSPTNSQIPHHSPISPVAQDAPPLVQYQSQSQDYSHVYQPQQFFPSYQQQQTFIPQQGVSMIYSTCTDDGAYTVHQVQQPPLQYPAAFQYPYQPQQVQTPVFYPVHGYHPQPMLDGSNISSNDSGMVDPNVYHPGYQQAPMQFYPQYPAAVQPMYYAATAPVPQTPQIAQVAPIFSVAQQASQSQPLLHATHSHPSAFTSSSPSVVDNADEASGENATST